MLPRPRIIYLVAKDVVFVSLRERLMYGLLVLSVLFIMMANLPFVMKGLATFKEHPPLTNALQIGFAFINIFMVLISVFSSVGILQDMLSRQKLALVFSKPVDRREYLSGIISGIGVVMLFNWLIMTACLWLVTVVHLHKLNLFIFPAMFISFIVALIGLSLVIFFYMFIPNNLSGIFSLFILIAGFGASIPQEMSSGGQSLFMKATRIGFIFIPRINLLWGVSMDMLGIFSINVNYLGVLIHTVIFILAINIISILRFAYLRTDLLH